MTNPCVRASRVLVLLSLAAFVLPELNQSNVRADNPTGPARIAEDKSLTTEEYMKLGMPAPDRAWRPADYQAAQKVLEILLKKDPLQLPRYKSKNSGAVFARISSLENFDIVKDKKLPAQQRLQLAVQYAEPMKTIMLLYLQGTNKVAPFDSEMLDMMVMMVHWGDILFPLANEFRATLPADDPQAEARKKGMDQMRGGCAEIMGGCWTTFTEHNTYRTPELVRFAKNIKPAVPRLLKELPPLTQKETPGRIQKLIDDEKDPNLKAALSDILTAIKAPR